MCLEDEVYVVPEAYSLSVRKSQEVVVVQDRVEGFDPLGIHVAVAY